MKNLFTKRTLFILIIILGIISGIVLIRSLQKGNQTGSSEESPTENTNQTDANLPKIKKPILKSAYPEIAQTYTIKPAIPNTISLPSALAMYKAEKNTFEEKDIFEIAKNLGFTSKPSTSKNYTGETVYAYYEGTKTLEILSNQQVINLNTDKSYSDTMTVTPDRKTIEKSVNDYLKQNKLLGESQNVELITTQFFRKDEEEGVKTLNANNPTIGVTATLTKNLDGYAIIGAGSQSGNIEVSLNAKLEVVSLRMAIVPDTTKQGIYPLKNRDQILAGLPEATIQDISVSSPGEIYSSTITTVTINHVQIVYVPIRDTEQTLLHPVYALKGLVTFFNGRTAPVTLYLPAISSEYFE